ncbi:MAG TPA: ABC transporter ATP-binding protein [Hyphomicrobiaceae bacterium]|nr:ABC transporter ATP-binding protein [Hyphomicrobiaceae bacterium]
MGQAIQAAEAVGAGTPPLLSIESVSVELPTRRGPLRAVDGVSLSLAAGRTLGIVGESGSGKTMLSRAVAQLLPASACLSGRVRFDGQDLTALSPQALRRLRGRAFAFVFQDPMTSLNPVLTVGGQITETLKEHLGLDGAAAVRRAIELLAQVGIPNPEQRLKQYPHQFSGGMRQRVAIAIALSCEPKLLIADEPTTALDVTVQAQILDLLAREQRRRHMAMILITHDLAVVAGRTDAVAVMYAGRVVERAPTRTLFRAMRMPYTRALIAAIPKLDAPPHTPLPAISGLPPDPTRPSPGCAFAPRCASADAQCRTAAPPLKAVDVGAHQFACWHPLAGAP